MDLARSVEAEVIGGMMGHGKGYSTMGSKADHKCAYSSTSASGYKGTSYVPPTNRPRSEEFDYSQRHPSAYPSKTGSRQSVTGMGSQYQDKSLNSTGASGKNMEGRIFSHQEYLNRKAKGLCFKCGEPFNPMHMCANKSMRILFYVDDEEVSEE